MARTTRLSILFNHQLIHKIIKGHNNDWIFKNDSDKDSYLHNLYHNISSQAAQLKALCIMSNHTHELYTVGNNHLFYNFMRNHHSKFCQNYNKIYNRSGKVTIDRPKTIPIQSEQHEILCTLYIHTNPLRSKMIHTLSDLNQYPYTSHSLYLGKIMAQWQKKITLPKWYIELGSSTHERQRVYTYLMEEYLLKTEEHFWGLIGGKTPKTPVTKDPYGDRPPLTPLSA